MENASSEVSLAVHSAMVLKKMYHLPVVLFTKDNMDADKSVPVVILQPVSVVGGPTM